MVSGFENCYLKYVHWLKNLLERLGREPAMAIWRAVIEGEEDECLDELLATGWETVASGPVDVEASIAEGLAASFGVPVEGLTAEEARRIIEGSWPIRQVRQRFSDLNVVRDTTTYEALHLFHRGYAMLAEAMLDQYGKQGELIAYDVKLRWVKASSGMGMKAEEFLELFKVPLDPGTFQGAGLKYRLVRATDSEAVLHIEECELARYYQAHHPRVGYLMACSMDEAEYRSVNDRIRMQRTSTIMEGGEVCDFRIYVIDEALGKQVA
jgi:hypothetical protein